MSFCISTWMNDEHDIWVEWFNGASHNCYSLECTQFLLDLLSSARAAVKFSFQSSPVLSCPLLFYPPFSFFMSSFQRLGKHAVKRSFKNGIDCSVPTKMHMRSLFISSPLKQSLRLINPSQTETSTSSSSLSLSLSSFISSRCFHYKPKRATKQGINTHMSNRAKKGNYIIIQSIPRHFLTSISTHLSSKTSWFLWYFSFYFYLHFRSLSW